MTMSLRVDRSPCEVADHAEERMLPHLIDVHLAPEHHHPRDLVEPRQLLARERVRRPPRDVLGIEHLPRDPERVVGIVADQRERSHPASLPPRGGGRTPG